MTPAQFEERIASIEARLAQQDLTPQKRAEWDQVLAGLRELRGVIERDAARAARAKEASLMAFDMQEMKAQLQEALQSLDESKDDVLRAGLNTIVDLGNRAQAKLDEMDAEGS